MATVHLGYGKTQFEFGSPGDTLGTVGPDLASKTLSDAEIGARLESPVDSPQIEEIVGEGGSVLIVVPDATRKAAAGEIVNLLVRRLIAAGIMPYDINAAFATGIHRTAREEEKAEILTPFVAQRVGTIDHRPRDLMQITRVGTTSGGIPVDLNRALLDFDHVITIGAVTYHYFAGFTGGRKLICPGLASSRTISETHRLAFDFERHTRAEGVGIGRLEGNPVHEAFLEAAALAPPVFSVNTIVSPDGAAEEVFCGQWQSSHEAACTAYAERHEVTIAEKRALVIVSCGGYPYDINLIQAHKALETASHACEDGGTILFIAECGQGLGRPDFLEWFTSGTSDGIAEELVRGYKVNGQTAWSLMKKAERFDVRILTDLPGPVVESMGMKKTDEYEAARLVMSSESGWVLPFGARFLPVIGSREK